MCRNRLKTTRNICLVSESRLENQTVDAPSFKILWQAPTPTPFPFSLFWLGLLVGFVVLGFEPFPCVFTVFLKHPLRTRPPFPSYSPPRSLPFPLDGLTFIFMSCVLMDFVYDWLNSLITILCSYIHCLANDVASFFSVAGHNSIVYIDTLCL